MKLKQLPKNNDTKKITLKSKTMKKKYFLIIFSLFFIACGSNSQDTEVPVKIITTLFPQYDFTKQITLEKANVELIIPPGIEPHSFEPTPQEIIEIQNADLFIYTSKYMEPWAYRLIENLQSKKPLIVDVSQNIKLLSIHNEHIDHLHDHKGTHQKHSFDPHIWTEPENAKIIVQNIVHGLIKINPKDSLYYQANAEKYLKKLDSLSMQFDDLFAHTKKDIMIFGGHFAFRYLAKKYHFKYLSPYRGFSPNSEPNPKTIAQLIDKIRQYNIKYIFHEELLNPKTAKILTEQTGTKMLLLHGVHNISKEEIDNGETYIKIMQRNIEALKIGLEYEK